MARPKSDNPTKGRINLTVSAQTRAELDYISAHSGMSISQFVATCAAKEAKKISRQRKETTPSAPDPNQITLDNN